MCEELVPVQGRLLRRPFLQGAVRLGCASQRKSSTFSLLRLPDEALKRLRAPLKAPRPPELHIELRKRSELLRLLFFNAKLEKSQEMN